jgi:hypothetical protein
MGNNNNKVYLLQSNATPVTEEILLAAMRNINCDGEFRELSGSICDNLNKLIVGNGYVKYSIKIKNAEKKCIIEGDNAYFAIRIEARSGKTVIPRKFRVTYECICNCAKKINITNDF